MFSRTQDDLSTPPAKRNGNVSVLAADLNISGVIASEGAIELHGKVDGELAAAAVTIGADGRMKGKVQAGQVDVLGRLEGTVACGTLTLRAAAHVHADCQSARLIIESGAVVEGHFTRPPPPPAPPAPPTGQPAATTAPAKGANKPATTTDKPAGTAPDDRPAG